MQNSIKVAQEIIKRRRELLASVGLSDKEDMPISALSGGQKQRLAIASIMAMNTPIIILDEPVAAIDPEGAKDIYNLLVNLNKRYNKTIIVTTRATNVIPLLSFVLILFPSFVITKQYT